ncbi:MAG: hypothetical protein D4S01_06180 [Dehalococcoidia bacterium]|nr:MAG: hypothetical protein D4S01_06180 [Dehalococcoidia bacterium]
MAKNQKPKCPIQENLKKVKPRLIKKAEIDKNLMNEAVNKSVAYLSRTLSASRTSARDKKEIALKLATKAMPSDLVLTDKDGKSFVEMMKELHGKGSTGKASKVEK